MRSLLGRKIIVCGINLILSFILIKILFFRNKHQDHEVNVYGIKQVRLDFKNYRGYSYYFRNIFSDISILVFLHLLEQIDSNKLHVLILVPYTHSQSLMEHWSATSVEKDTRMQEIVQSVQKTLKHPEIGNVFIFYQDLQLLTYLEKQNLDNQEKIVFVPNMEDTMAILFRYANEHLEGHVVMVINADVYPDEGFEKLDYALLRQQRLMYCISRYLGVF